MIDAISRCGEFLCREYGADWGTVGGEDFSSCVVNKKRAEGFSSALMAVFPYYFGQSVGKISLYARYADYHAVLQTALEAAAAMLPEGTVWKTGADISPIKEVRAAALAGLGVVGKNGLLITPKYGSFVFIGEILLNTELESSRGEIGFCAGCGECVTACPTGALCGGGECLSSLTQKKRLTPEEAEIIRRHGSEWGCDICQTVCPMNRNAEKTRIPEFSGKTLPAVTEFETAELDDAAVLEKYRGRAFLWRGAKVIKRNEELIRGE